MMRPYSLSSSSSLTVTPQNPKLSPAHSFFLPPLPGTTAFSFSSNPTYIRKGLSLKCRQSEYFDQQKFATTNAQYDNSSFAPQTPSRADQLPARFYVGHSIYKGKAALTVEPKAPEFTALDSGAFKISKEGFVLLQFAPAAGVRVYDWSRKQVFSLSVTEIGNLVSLGATGSCEFFHDPFKGRSEEGQVRKMLKVEPLPDGSGHFFNLSVQNKLINLDESIYIPVTRAEFAVLNSAFNFILPHLLGWSAFANSIKPEEVSRGNNASPKYGGDYEWKR
ncbi:single-stranded DNA-binding protein WHY1, chloroplastic-like [Humulus lupulus]|uniref:single-stranded DNA-binding protein WHY1, chloroplastic-like n=1 Tax=Humulus lupulus TaxID=3486 RepID=UPI002B403B1B|nr:single-stranded DNA-binding protein WHY1, chloroplastic-like [Humulus lupulus]